MPLPSHSNPLLNSWRPIIFLRFYNFLIWRVFFYTNGIMQYKIFGAGFFHQQNSLAIHRGWWDFHFGHDQEYHSSLLLGNISLYTCTMHTFHLAICPLKGIWIDPNFWLLPIKLHKNSWTSFWVNILFPISCNCPSRGDYILRFLKTAKMFFRVTLLFLYSHQQYTSDPVSPIVAIIWYYRY